MTATAAMRARTLGCPGARSRIVRPSWRDFPVGIWRAVRSVACACCGVDRGHESVLQLGDDRSVSGFVWDASWAYFLSRLAGFSRLIVFDKRGTGLSDRTEGIPSLEERMDDLRAVMDAAGSDRAALFGFSEGGPMSLLFAASYPERVRAIGIYGSYVRGSDLSGDLLTAKDRAKHRSPRTCLGYRRSGKEFCPKQGSRAGLFPPPRALGTPRRQPICRNQVDADEHGDRCAAYPSDCPGTDADNAPAR